MAQIADKHCETDGAVRTSWQDNDSELVGLRVCQKLGDITLSADTTINTNTITLVGGHGVTAGNVICLRQDGRFYQAIATAVATNDVTLDTPLDYAFTTLAVGFRSNANANVNGAVTPVVFSVSPPSGTKWDLYGCSFHILDNAAMDDAKFGGIAALTKGIIVRKKNATYKNILNIKSNSDFAFRCDEIFYSDNAPSGFYGFRAKKTFNIRHGIVIRLDASKNEEFQVIIQEYLTGLDSVGLAVWGHVVEGQ